MPDPTPITAVWTINGDHCEPVLDPVLRNVHHPALCTGQPCTIHHPSEHPLRSWALHWRDDRGMFERVCAHGIGHPDPDQVAFWERTMREQDAAAEAVHGCDGCCVKAAGHG